MTYSGIPSEQGHDPLATAYEAGAGDLAAEALVHTYFFPPDMIGGSCPLVKGEEEALAWNAAAEGCASERIHLVWRVHDERVWFLAIRSSDLSSASDSWCPFASLLPGTDDAVPSPVIYTHYTDEAATLMAVDRDTLQIIRGTSSVIRAKAERMARDMGNAEIFDLVPDTIIQLKAAKWKSLSLLEDRARRFFGFASVVSAVLVTLMAGFVWFSASMVQIAYKADLKSLEERSNAAVLQLQQSAMVLRTSEMREQLAAFTRLNESMVTAQGWLKLYMLQAGALKWWAVVPSNLTSDRIQELGGVSVESTDDGLVIANNKASVLPKGQLKLP
jgi:hypothetical protein